MNIIQEALGRDKEDEEVVVLVLHLISCIVEEKEMGSQLAEMVTKEKSLFFDHLMFVIESSAESVQQECLKLLLKLLDTPQVACKLQQDLIDTPGAIQMVTKLIESDICKLSAIEFLTKISRFQPDIQKMVVFAGAAERALEIAEEEGGVVMGGIMARSCYNLVQVLIDENHGNQDFLVSQQNAHRIVLSLFDFDASVGGEATPFAHNADKFRETSEAAWKMLASFLSLDSPGLNNMQAILLSLLSRSTEYAIVDGCHSAASFLAKMLSNNNSNRLLFLRLHVNSSSVLYLLVKEALNSARLDLILVFGALLSHGSRFPDGQLNIASTMAPGAESPGLLIVETLVDMDMSGVTEKAIQSVATAFQLLSFMLYDNREVKERFKGYKSNADGQPINLLEHIVTQLLYLNTKSDRVMVSGLSCLIIWLEGCDDLLSFLLEESGGIVQCLLERILRSQSAHKPMGTAISGLSAFLLAMFIPKSSELKDVIRARIGNDLFVARLDALSESELLLEKAYFIPPMVSLFRNKYPALRTLFSSTPLAEDPRDEQLRLLRMQLNDSDGSLYRQIMQDNARLRQENVALLEQVMNGEVERQELLTQIGKLEEQLGGVHSGGGGNFLKNLRSVLLPEFKDQRSVGSPNSTVHNSSPTFKGVLNI